MFLKILCIQSTQNLTKKFFIIKLTAILILAGCLQASAKEYSQKITLYIHGASLEHVFKEIKKQPGYNFLCPCEILQEAGQVDVNGHIVSLKDDLQQCLQKTILNYSIVAKTILIKKEEAQKIENLMATPVVTALPPPPVEIKGRVVNNEGSPLKGVSVLVVGTQNGTSTNSDGQFTLTVSDDKNIVLEISSVGFQTKSVNVDKGTEVNVVLEEATASLSDVVVVGYGTKKR